MINKFIKIFLCFAFSLTFAQDNSTVQVVNTETFTIQIDGMHCAGGCAKGLETALNNTDGIQAKVNFIAQNTPGNASITYDPNIFSDNQIVDMINTFRGGKFTAAINNNTTAACSKGKNCCRNTGQLNPQCDNKSSGCCSTSNKNCKKKQKKNK